MISASSCSKDDYTEYTLPDGTKILCKDTYKIAYQAETDKDKFNYLSNSWTYNSDQYANMVDGLIENDEYGKLRGAIAESWSNKVNSNGTQTWTIKLKKGVKWVDNKTGSEYGEVVADDFVSGIKYVLNPAHGSSTVGVVTNVINNALEYYTSLTDDDTNNDMDFKDVGVKAVDDYTLEYTTSTPTPYFLSCLTYSPFLPVNQEYLDEQGSDFGASENNILVNGPFRMTRHDYQNKIILTKNESYWDKDNVFVKQVIETYLPQDSAISKMREWYESGIVDSFTVEANDEEGYERYVGDDYLNPKDPTCSPVLSQGDSTYIGYFNFARYTYEYNAEDKYKKSKGSQDAVDTNLALLNVNVRKSILHGLDMTRYLKRFGNEDIANQRLTRTYTIPELAIDEEGKDYTSYVVDVYNEKNNTSLKDLTGATNGMDPILDQEYAKELLKQAKNELINAGVKSFPITFDVIGSRNATLKAYEEDMYTDFNNNVGNGIIRFQIVTPQSDDQDKEWGSMTANYDFSIWSGWGPDYADPETFLHTMVVDGDMVENLGFIDNTTQELEQKVLGEYTKLYNKGVKEYEDLSKRYRLFAEAEYKLIYEDALVIPWYTKTGYYNKVSKVVPYQQMKATYGLSSVKHKYIYVSKDPITQELYNSLKENYDNNK